MFSRCIAIMVSSWLPAFALTLPLSPAHRANALIAGSLATLFAFGALADNRLRIATALIGGWVALSPFLFDSTLTEEVLAVTWGVTTFVFMAGPFADTPRVEHVSAHAPKTHAPVEDSGGRQYAHAA